MRHSFELTNKGIPLDTNPTPPKREEPKPEPKKVSKQIKSKEQKDELT